MKSNKNNKTIWIAWERHRRTIELCKYFDIPLLALVSNRSRWIKHPYFCCKTLYAIIKQKPRILIVQNPSILLTFIACALKKVFGYILIVDSHNAGIIPDNIILVKIKFVLKYLQTIADITIVTNIQLANLISANNGSPFVLPDRIPDVEFITNKKISNDKFRAVYICTFGSDEPYEKLIEAAGNIDINVIFYVTGNISKLHSEILRNKPENVIFTGFLPDEYYWDLLYSSDLIIDLTRREDCILCGAYEALAVEVPMLLTDTYALRKYFYKGTVFSKNTVEDLTRSLIYAISNIQCFKNEIMDLKNELNIKWEETANSFLKTIQKYK